MFERTKLDTLKQGATVVILAVSAVVLSRLVNWPRAVRIITDADPLFFALALFSYYATIGLRGIRWRILLSNIGADITFQRAYVVVLLGLFLICYCSQKAVTCTEHNSSKRQSR